MDWKNTIRFRDYCNSFPIVAKEYETIKVKLCKENPIDPGREKYLAGKHDFIMHTLRKAQVWYYLGKTVTVTIDRPIGSAHPKNPNMIYPVNYGYIEGEIAPDGVELDAYILGEDKPLSTFTGQVIAIIHRQDDIEDKLVTAPIGKKFTEKQIHDAIFFQEQYFKSKIQMLE